MEKRTHLILKRYFEDDTGNMEIPYLGFVCDIKNGDRIYEIQTGNFGSMRNKLDAFLVENEVTVIYPIAAVKHKIWLDPETGEMVTNRKSPKRANEYELLPELVYIMPYLKNPRLHFMTVMMDIDEYRWLNGWSRDKKRGSRKYETIPNELIAITEFKCAEDFRFFIPKELAEHFTITEYSKAVGIPYSIAQRCIKVLEAAGVVAESGKQGRCKLFTEIHGG